MSSRHDRVFVVSLGGLLLLLSNPLFAQDRPKPPPNEERWHVVLMQGKKCGHMMTSVRTLGEEVRSRSVMQIEIARNKAKIKIAFDQRYRETLDGKPISLKADLNMGGEPATTTGVIKDGKIHLVMEQFGSKRELTHDFDPEILFPYGQLLETRRRGLQPGTKYRIKGYEPSQKVDGPIETEIVVQGKETVEVLGKKRELTRVTATALLPVPIASDLWVDDEGNPIITTIKMGIVDLQVVASSKEEALRGEGEAPEMFLETLVRANRRVPAEAQSVRMRLRLPADGTRFPELPTTGMQKFKRISDHEAELVIRRIDWKKLRGLKEAPAADREQAAKYLKASTLCDIKDRQIRRLAVRAVGKAATPAEKADALRKFVTDYVTDKGLDVAFATASEVARSRQGDCSEHGVLLAALARAANLPARGVSGLVQIPEGTLGAGREGVFGYHMWTQVYIDGQWVDIDAALRQTDCDPTHIALALPSLNDEGLIDSMLNLLPLLGRLEIEITEVK